VHHLLRALGVQGRIKSPTFAVVEPYEVSVLDQVLAISHFDFYRFSDPREWEDAGFRDLFAAPGLKLCEWADKAAPLLPVPDLRLHLQVQDDDQRLVRADACTPLGLELLR
jgi:tRNA threonylcarbamoyladenosine biosynthesis protein TsaE